MKLSPWGYFGLTFAKFAGGMMMTSYAVLRWASWSPLLLLVGYLLTVNGARNMALVINHQCGHYRFTSKRKVDRFVGEMLSTILCSQDAVGYQHDHSTLHHGGESFSSDTDPVLTFIKKFGYRPGSSRTSLWLHTIWLLFSPYFHGVYFFSRVRSNFVASKGIRRLASCVYWAGWVAFMALHPHGLRVWLVSFAVPVILVYQQSAFLELLTEHAWFIPRLKTERPREFIAARCWGRFCGSPVPEAGLPLTSAVPRWLGWFAATTLYHLPMRVLVLCGDAPQHDYHHRHPGAKEWTSPAYARQHDIDTGHKGWPEYWDVWGMHVAVNHVFDAIGGHVPDFPAQWRPESQTVQGGAA
jgi:fatty acid desaturase